ncbi:MAG: TetR family transcriptional regulator [Candidatus Krumholzibacteria bacterium]|nr:TetR family transcriptional regulator [Candidatus Krumholzibacteria bacterium]
MQYNKSQGVERREREKLRCKGEIIAAALKLFAQQGIEKTSMKQIADGADMSVGKLYACFQGKDEIIRALLSDSMKSLQRIGDEACRGTDAPLEQIRCRLVAAVDHFKAHLDFLVIYHNESPMSCEGMIREHIDANIGTVAKLLARAIDDGDIPPEDPYALAAIVVGSVHELMHAFAERGGKDALGAIPAIIDRIIIKPLETRRQKDSGMEGR